jgi:hypothetical protein
MGAIGLGTVLAAIAWLPAAAWLLARRGTVPDRRLLAALAWGVVVVVTVVVVSAAGGLGARAGAANWLLLETFVGWLVVTYLRTRRPTPD